MKKKLKLYFTSLACLMALSVFSGSASAAQSTNYAENTETWELRYNGYIQFKPSYVVPANAGYGLKQGYTVCQAYINYSRNGESIIGGRKYTAKKLVGNDIVSTSESVWDNLIPGEKRTTIFNYGWVYLAPDGGTITSVGPVESVESVESVE